MNNLTSTTEALPKTGHVNEVCKEWLVREDGALAYKLQSQEINDFYKGNRYRNATVREDFPTALHEQIKETENAERQAEAYRRRLQEQEEHDKRVAKEIAEKLERDLREQRQREQRESELIAQQMQEMYVNLPPVPPPAARDRNKPPPARPPKASILQQQQHQSTNSSLEHNNNNNTNITTTSSSSVHHNRHNRSHQQQQSPKSPQQQQQQQQQKFPQLSNIDGCYVGITLSPTGIKPTTTTTATNHNLNLLVSDELSPSARGGHPTGIGASKFSFAASSSPPVGAAAAAGPSSLSSNASSNASSSARRNVFDFIGTPSNAQAQTPSTPHTPLTPHALQHTPPPLLSKASLQYTNEEYIEYADVADSIRRYDINGGGGPSTSSGVDAIDCSPVKGVNKLLSPSRENLLKTDKKFQKLSPEKYDELMGNKMALPGMRPPTGLGAGAGAVGAEAERLMQEHADDIELYVDPCDYASLKEIGLPLEEIKELSKKMKQEQKDELLARRLQEMEAKERLSLEERDRMLAIEAQDKELARMLQEREKAKVKRAKEKARLRKAQQREAVVSANNALHAGPVQPLPQDNNMPLSKYSTNGSSPSASLNHSGRYTEDPALDLEPYSSPIDMLATQNHQRQNGLLTNGSLTRSQDTSPHGTVLSVSGQRQAIKGQQQQQQLQQRHHARSHDDDIYTLPVDSCPNAGQGDARLTGAGPRPASLFIESEHHTNNNSMTRSENYSQESHDSLSSSHDKASNRLNYSKTGSFDQNASPIPPYMPIQGTRRSNSGEERKKRSKDNKCTHQ